MKNKHNIFIYLNGSKYYYTNDHLNRENGPAYISRLTKQWFNNNIPHRLDGPALIYLDGRKDWQVWYYNGKYINCNTQEEFERLIKLRLLW